MAQAHTESLLNNRSAFEVAFIAYVRSSPKQDLYEGSLEK